MPDVNVYEAFRELIQRLFSGDEEIAELAAKDPDGLLAAYGITDGDLDGVDFRQVVDDCYHDYDLPEGSKQALQSYVAGDPPPAHYQVKEPPHANGHQAPEQAVQHLQYVTYATYEEHEHITQEIVNRQLLIDSSDNRVFNIDNSTDVAVDVGGDLDGDITVAPTAATAAGDGAVANIGDDNVTATGDEAIVGDDNIVTRTDGDGDALVAARGSDLNAATGDGSVQGGEIGAANTGQVEGVLAGEDVRGAVNTGQNDGVIADGRVENPVIGDGNQTANLDIDASGGNAAGTGGSATGGTGETRFDDDAFDNVIDGSASGGDGSGGDASGGTLGDFNVNFGDGDQSASTVQGDVSNSAISSGGDADNDLDAFSRLRAITEPSAQEAELQPLEEAQPVEIGNFEEAATDDFGSGTVEDVFEDAATGSDEAVSQELGA